jgi:hypothetical protein
MLATETRFSEFSLFQKILRPQNHIFSVSMMSNADMNPDCSKIGDMESGLMPSGFEPDGMDIVCGRGWANVSREGNKAFTAIIQINLHLYLKASCRVEKTAIVGDILDRIVGSGARFFKKDKNTQRWRQMNREESHVKIGHAIRDMIRHHGKDVATLRQTIKRSPRRFQRAHSARAKKTHPVKRHKRSRSLSDLSPKTVFAIDEDVSDTRSSFANVFDVFADTLQKLSDMNDDDPPCDDNMHHINSSGNLRNIFDETPLPVETPCATLHDEMIHPVFMGLDGFHFQRSHYNLL